MVCLRTQTKFCFAGGVAVFVVFSATVLYSAEKLQPTPAEQSLELVGIKTDKELIEFLQSWLPDSRRTLDVAKFIKQLGSRSFQEREEATRRLGMFPISPVDELTNATKSDNPEVRRRAGNILGRLKNRETISVKIAALETVTHRRIKGLSPLLLKLTPDMENAYQLSAAISAITVSARSEDITLLKSSLHVKNHRNIRVAAVRVLSAIQGKESLPDLLKLLSDRDDSVLIAVATGLAKQKHRGCLPVLLKLLEADEITIRVQAAQLLRAISSQRYGFVAYDKPANRKAAIGKWTRWISGTGRTAELKTPSRNLKVGTGRTLYCVWSKKILIEIDSQGRKLFEAGGFSYIWGCQGLANGHRLAIDFSGKFVVEYDAKGKQVWKIDKLASGPTSVERLANGNTLLALPNAGKIIELNRQGKTVWEVDLKGRPTTAQRLPNGLTVVNLQFGKQVVDIDRKGKVIHKLTGPKNALTAQRLANGNTLVCDMGDNRAVEYDPNGNIVWSKAGFTNPAQAQRIANGNTLVSDNTGLHEIDPQGKEVWKYRTTRGKFFRF
jgi:HEAT repeat protein